MPSNQGFHSQRTAFAIAASAGMLATFLPWVEIPLLGSVSGTAGDGWITLALFVPALVMSFKGKKHLPLTFGSRVGVVIPATLALWIGFDKISTFGEITKKIEDNPISKALSSSIKIGPGIYLLIAAGIAIIVITFVFPKPSKPVYVNLEELGQRLKTAVASGEITNEEAAAKYKQAADQDGTNG